MYLHIPRFFDERSCLKLAYAELVGVRQWARRVKMSESELRQLEHLRNELREERKPQLGSRKEKIA